MQFTQSTTATRPAAYGVVSTACQVQSVRPEPCVWCGYRHGFTDDPSGVVRCNACGDIQDQGADAMDLPSPCPYCGSREGEYEDDFGWSRCYTCGGN